jgi:hypothetical protein
MVTLTWFTAESLSLSVVSSLTLSRKLHAVRLTVRQIGLYTGFPGNITWISNNLAGTYKRSVGLAIHVSIGNLGGAMSSNFYRSEDKPKFILGHSLSLAFAFIALGAVLTLRFGYQHCNKKREQEGDRGLSPEELSDLGDKAPTYRYML